MSSSALPQRAPLPLPPSCLAPPLTKPCPPPPPTRSRRPFRDAAALASTCAAAAAAYRESKWFRKVRIDSSGAVLEPASGTFDVTVAPGENVQAAVNRCPPGGSVLLLPGMHDGPLTLSAGREVHAFGRGRALMRAADGTLLTSHAVTSTLDGLLLRHEKHIMNQGAVWIRGGGLRVQACHVTSAGACIVIEGGANPLIIACR